MKRESDQLQKLGEALLTLRSDLMDTLRLPEKLLDAISEAKRITNFEGKRRQMQFVGKLMRKLEDTQRDAIHAALDEQQNGSAAEKLALHQAEHWRDRLIADQSGSIDAISHQREADRATYVSGILQADRGAKTHEARAAELEQAPVKFPDDRCEAARALIEQEMLSVR